MKLAIVIVVVMGALAGCGVSSTAYWQKAEVRSSPGATDAQLARELETRAEKYIRECLKNPYSAKFHSNKAERLPAGTQFGFRKIKEGERMFQVVTVVEATNGFGAFLVDRWVTEARYNEQKHRWEIINPPTPTTRH